MSPSQRRLDQPDTGPTAANHPSATDPYVQRHRLAPVTNLNDGSFSLSSRPAFGRKGTRDVLKGLPNLPFNSLQLPQTSYLRPVSDIGTVSSVYSQPSPEMQSSFIPDRLHIPHRPDGQLHDVSPPESLSRDDGTHDSSRRSSPDVSPVTENSSPVVERPPVSGKPSSGIPVLKKTQRFGSAGNMWTNWRGKAAELSSSNGGSSTPKETRWDDYSGERTTSEKGKPGQVDPRSVPFDAKPGHLAPSQTFGTTTTISGGNEPVRRKKVPVRDGNFTPAVREEWKGASGRHKIINPLMDKPLPPGKSAIFPTGSRRLSESPDEQTLRRDVISPTSGLALSPISDEPTPTRDRSRQPSILVDESVSIEPPQPVKPPSPISIVTAVDHPIESSRNSALSPEDTRSPLARHPSTEGMKLKPEPITPEATPNSSREGHSPNDINDSFRSNFEHLDLKPQPQSRFSATTYAPTVYDSPPATPETSHESPMPTPPSSILNRKRPVPVAGIPNKRKPTPSEAEQARDRRHSKTLPKSPPEIEAQDLVASLQASLENLRRRKNNVNTILHELTNVVQPSSIAYDMAARKEVKRTVDGLNRELAEIMKEEHETGLKLHRAWKRQDNSSLYEPTTLWVRRVTT
ncbi:MAG: hypothetical protein L6R38_004625 [Xanthoria sp. 2 TBL-2021]|nr:MAG: hypothetical protein L6R38_004625 [Xanthoria sp. 2 TBL-2021]